MRVIAGEARGRQLVAPEGRSVRPTSDRVREAVFNALFSMGGVDGATVVDLFAGSGALGIEALSRGAQRAVFVERDVDAVRCIEVNLESLDMNDRAEIVRGDAWTWLDRNTSPVDLAFCDPPYEFDEWPELLDRLDAGIVVVETDRSLPTLAAWRLEREKAYGATVVSIISRVSGPGDRAEATP